MPSVDYSYQLSTTCSGGVNIDALSYDIRSSAIKHALHYVYVDNDSDNVIVWFRDTLDSEDEAILLYLLQNHRGLPLSLSLNQTATMSGIIVTDTDKTLIINEEGRAIGISQQMPFHVTTTTVAAPHSISGEDHYGVLNDSQIPSSITRDSELTSAINSLDFYTTNEIDTIVSGLAAWDHNHDLRYIRINNQIIIDHGSISGLGDNDHPQYLLNTDFTIYSGTLQSQINGKASTSHTHDDRYYTETELDNGQLDSRYYTESELATGQLDSRYYTESEINSISGTIVSKIVTDHGTLGGLGDDDHPQYLTQVRADQRYYTEAEVDTISGSLLTLINYNYSTLQNVDTNLNIKINTTSGTLQYAIDNKDHGTLLGLADDDHTQYFNQTRGDLRYSQLGHTHDERYYTESEVNTISGVIVSKIITDHGALAGLSDDDHPQYHDDARGDIRYYTKTAVDTISGTINNKIITTSGALQININSKSDIGHIHDDRYYTETELDNGQLNNIYYTESEVNTISGILQSSINTKLPLTGGTVNGNLVISGNLLVSGTQFITTTETVSISDNIVYVNAGEVGAGVTKGTAGMQIDRGTLADYLFVFDESSDTFRVGISGSLQAVATREDSPTNNYIAYWNDSAKRFDTSNSILYTDIASKIYVNTTSGVLNTLINNISGSLQTSINSKSDIGHTHDDRYYTETELNNGQLDNRYYTESEVNTISGNITSQLHGRSHSITSTADHTAGVNKVFYSNSSGQIVELDLGASGTVLFSNGTSSAPVFGASPAAMTSHGNEYHTSTFITSSGVNFTNLNTNGSVGSTATTVAIGNHLHTGVYEPVISPKNTAFNVNFGTIASTACEGNDVRLSDARLALLHGNERHTQTFITLSGVNYTNLSFNGAVGSGSNQVAQGNHTHPGGTHDRLHTITSTADHSAGFNKVFYSDTVGTITELPLGASGTILSSKGPTSAPAFIDAAGIQSVLTSFSGTSACLTVLLSANATMSTSWGDISWGTIAHSNSSDVIKRDDTLTDRFYCYDSGAYTVSLNLTAVCNGGKRVDCRTILNDLTIVSGSEFYLVDSASEQIGIQFSMNLTAGDFITLQGMAQQNGDYFLTGGRMCITRIGGMKGDKGIDGLPGPTGAGSSVNIYKDGVTVTNLPFSILNFQNMTVASGTISGSVDIQNTFGSYFQEASSEVDSSTTSASWTTKVSITTPTLPSGKYRIGWHYNMFGASTSVSPRGRVIVNGTDTIHHYLYEPKDASTNEEDTISGFYYTTTSGVKTINLDYASETAGSSLTIRRARLEFWRVS